METTFPDTGLPVHAPQMPLSPWDDDDDDEGMCNSDYELVTGDTFLPVDKDDMQVFPDDSSFASMSMDIDFAPEDIPLPSFIPAKPVKRHRAHAQHSAPSILPSLSISPIAIKPNYKLLYQTHSQLHTWFCSCAYHLSTLQTRGAPPTNTHTSTMYCLQLYTYQTTGVQVLFTGSRDQLIREWNLTTHGGACDHRGAREQHLECVCA
jgi:F-box and WD-40 domain protein 1/11